MDSFEARAREAFDGSVEGLDAPTRSRLTRARHRALAATDKFAGRLPRMRIWGPAVAAACALVLAVALWTGAPQPALVPAPIEHGNALEDLDIVASNEELELFDDDLDFYRWAAEAPDAREASVG